MTRQELIKKLKQKCQNLEDCLIHYKKWKKASSINEAKLALLQEIVEDLEEMEK